MNGWVNNREAGDLRRHRAYYDVIVMKLELKPPKLKLLLELKLPKFELGVGIYFVGRFVCINVLFEVYGFENWAHHDFEICLNNTRWDSMW